MTVFARYGLRLASMDAVAAEARVSRQSVYNHFANKEALFAAAVQALQQLAHDAARAAAQARREAGGDAIDELVAALAARALAFHRALAGTPHLGELIDEQGRLCAELVAQGHADFRALLGTQVAARRRSGELQLPRSTPTAEFVDDAITITTGLKHSDAANDEALLLRRLDRMVRQLHAGLLARREGPALR